MKLLFNQ